MKQILGLDIGVSSVGMAILTEDDNGQMEIKKLAVRVVPEDPNFHGKFYSGNTASKNLDRRTKRSARRNNQRFKQRRTYLYSVLEENNMFPDEDLMDLETLYLFKLRAEAVERRLDLKELGRVFIHLNQKRGFLSNRKSNSEEEEGSDFKENIKKLTTQLEGKTIGQALYSEIKNAPNPNLVYTKQRTYLRKNYIDEFNAIWDCQSKYYPDILTGQTKSDNIKGTLLALIRDKIIFFQRPLKSQKNLVSNCKFEKFHKGVNTSNPYFEMFRILQNVNDLSWTDQRGETFFPTQVQRDDLFQRLFGAEQLNKQNRLSKSEIKKFLGFKREDRINLNFDNLLGNRTLADLRAALIAAEVNDIERYLHFDHRKHDAKGGLFELWHIIYSIENNAHLIKALINRFDFSETQAKVIATKVRFGTDYSNLSTRAIRKLLPSMLNGKSYFEACEEIGYDHSGYKTKIEIQEKLDPIYPNELRNPVVEQVLNQMVNMVNEAISTFGAFDEIRVELARELKNNAQRRKSAVKRMNDNQKENDKVRALLKNDYNFSIVNGRDVKRYKLWNETEQTCLYCNNTIGSADFMNGFADIEHLIPKSRSFNNSMENFILAHRKCNEEKGQQTSFDFMLQKGSPYFETYIERVNQLYEAKKISIIKRDNLLKPGDKIESDFVTRMLKDTQYISKEAVKRLKTICENTHTSTGQITDFLRNDWELTAVLEELVLPKYQKIGKTQIKPIKNKGGIKNKEIPENWSKRDDHRHHAVDALITALTNPKIIYQLNNLNKIYQYEKGLLSAEELQKMKEDGENFDLQKFAKQQEKKIPVPIENLRAKTKKHLEGILISYKKSNSKVLTRNINKIKSKNGEVIKKEWTPRGPLHEETIYGKIKLPVLKKLSSSFSEANLIVNKEIRELVIQHLNEYNNNPKIAFSSKVLEKNPIIYHGQKVTEVMVFEESFSKRVNLSNGITPAQVGKIIDPIVREKIENRIEKYGGDVKGAFENLKDHPLYFNEEKGITIKSVLVKENNTMIPLREKRNHRGDKIHSEPSDFTILGSNHHALVYRSETGKFNVKLISFWEAVEIGRLNVQEHGNPYPIINRKDDDQLGKFWFSMQKNDLFVLDLKHSENPAKENEINFFDADAYPLLSEKLFRIQTISLTGSGALDLRLMHHLEPKITRNDKELKGKCWERFSSNQKLSRLTKIKVNHLGNLLKIGE